MLSRNEWLALRRSRPAINLPCCNGQDLCGRATLVSSASTMQQERPPVSGDLRQRCISI